MGVKILSLFDGMACGMIAMSLAGVEVESYDAYEIDKYAIKSAQHNFPMIKEHGDVFDADFTQYEGVDFLIGGSPCTYWSIAQTKNRETVASGMGWELFSQYVRALHEAKPKYFIYENNKSMSKQIRASIDDAFGFEAVLINSALVSAQNRQRLYWVGKRNEDGTYSKVNVEQPADRGILLKDVLDSVVARDLTCNDKSYTLTASYDGACAWNTIERHQRNMVAEPVCVAERGRMYCGQPQHYEARTDGKTNTLTSVEKDNRVAEPINVTEDGKSQTLKAQYCKNSVANFCCYSSTYGASGVAEPVGIKHLGSLYGQHSRWGVFDEEGKAPTLTASAGMGGGHLPMVKEPVKVGDVGNGGQGNRVYSVNGKAVAQTAQSGGMGSNTGLYAVPYDCDVVITENSIRCQRRDQKHSTVQGSHVNFTDGKTQTLSPSHIPNVIEPKSCGGFGTKTGLYAMHLDGFIPGERTVGSQMEFLGGINGRHEKWIEDGKNYSRNFSQGHRLYGVNGKAVTQTAQACGYAGNTGLYAIPTMPVKEATAKGYTEIECGDCVDLSMPNSKTRRGRNMADKANCMQTSNEFYQYVGYAIEFDDNGRPIKAIGKDGKEITIYEVRDGKITIKGKQYPIKLKDGYYIIRKLTVSECKRLQTVPEWYEFPVSNSQAYKMLGNGWTCEVIAHLIRSCMAE